LEPEFGHLLEFFSARPEDVIHGGVQHSQVDHDVLFGFVYSKLDVRM